MTESLDVSLDHLVFACADLTRGVETVAHLLGVDPVEGGRHPDWATRNALLGLDRRGYLEVVGPDPSVPPPPGGRGLGVEGAGVGRLVTWAVRVASIDDALARAASHGVDLGAVVPGSRMAADGTVLEWVLTDPATDRLGRTVPFLIDWGESRHPSESLAARGRLVGSVVVVRLRHPEPDRLRRVLEVVAVPASDRSTPVEVEAGPPSLEAILATPKGEVVLR